MDVFKMAWRNVWRNRRRSLVTVASMTLALFVMVLYAGLMEGYVQDMERSILDLEVGDVQIYAEDYRLNPSIYTRIPNPAGVLGPLDAAGFPATGRLLGFGLAASGDASAGVSFRGVEVVADARVSLVHGEVADGEWLDPGDPKGVVIGRRLARTLAVGTGGEVLVLSQGADGSMAYDLYRVRGILRGIGDATDRTGVFMIADTFRELMVVPDGVHQIIVRRPDDLELGSAAGRVREVAAGLDVKTWRELLPTLASLLDSARQIIVVMFVIVYVAIGILILNAMLMAVFERVREFGVLKAVGVGPFEVFLLIVIESGIQTAIALVVGLALALPALLYLTWVGVDVGSLAGVSMMGIAMQPVWHAAIEPRVFALPVVTLVAIVSVAVVYPGLKAALIQPVDAMRYH